MIVRIIGTLEKLLKSQPVQNLEKKLLPAVFVKAQKKKAFPATGHNYASAWTTDIAATCEKAGTESRHCTNENCTATTEQRSIAALGHNWKDNGDETAICTRNGCKATHTHAWDSGTITTEPTCTAKGEKTYHCTYEENGICTATKTEAVKKLGHRYILIKKEAPTCESDGILYGKCSRCSKTITKQDAKNPALGHDWKDNGDGTATCSREGCGKKHTHDLDSGTTTVAPTCTVTGEKEYCCTYTNCPYKKTESLKATGHKNKETRNYKKPTCQAEGYTGDIYCKDCGILLSSGKVTKKYDHDWDGGKVTKEATCKEEGIMTTYKVTSIGAKAFNNNKKLTKVTIGTNIVKINSNAFFNCKNLKTVTIKSVHLTGKTANKKAFKNAHKKLVIRVPKKVKRIYKKIFKGLKVK